MSARIMGSPTVPVLHIEDGGAIVRGLALPFGQPAVVVGPEGSWVEEIMDAESVDSIARDLPLLVSHRRDEPPAGIVRSTSVSHLGVGIEAKLVGSEAEIEGWRARFRHGLSAGLSVGFARTKRDVFEAPKKRGGLPIVRPRGIQIVEVSLVQWPAYERAGVTSLSVRSAADQQQHEESERIIGEMRGFLELSRVRAARRRERASGSSTKA